MIVKATQNSESGALPTDDMLSKMTKFNEELVKAGVLLEAAGLKPTSKGVRVHFDGPKRMVIDGPFTESKELIAGYWLLEVKSLEEAIEWCKRAPNPHDEPSDVEIRPLFDIADFPDASSDTIAKVTEIEKQIRR